MNQQQLNAELAKDIPAFMDRLFGKGNWPTMKASSCTSLAIQTTRVQILDSSRCVVTAHFSLVYGPTNHCSKGKGKRCFLGYIACSTRLKKFVKDTAIHLGT
jgi:hypothetical protein